MSPIEGITAKANERDDQGNVSGNQLNATISGPVGSPYEGGTFHLAFIYGLATKVADLRPKIYFLTKVYHPNIQQCDFDLCSKLFARHEPVTLRAALLKIQALLVQPNLNYLADKAIAEIYQNDRKTYEAIAAEQSYKHATKGQVADTLIESIVDFAGAEGFADRETYLCAVYDFRSVLDNCPQALIGLLKFKHDVDLISL